LEEDYNLYASNLSIGYQGSPKDIGEVVAFLACESSNFITGQKIAVNKERTFFIRRVKCKFLTGLFIKKQMD